MAITSADIAALPTLTDAELLKLYRHALATGAVGTTITINGRSVAIPPIDQLMKAITWLESRTAAESGADAATGIALISFGEAR
jgi:hypothetical protein